MTTPSLVRKECSTAMSRCSRDIYPLEISTEELQSAGPSLIRLGWERPKAGEIGLVVLDEKGREDRVATNHEKYPVAGRAASGRAPADGIPQAKCASQQRDAVALLTAAQRGTGDKAKAVAHRWLLRRTLFRPGALDGRPTGVLVKRLCQAAAALVRCSLRRGDPQVSSTRDDGSPWFAIVEDRWQGARHERLPAGELQPPQQFRGKATSQTHARSHCAGI